MSNPVLCYGILLPHSDEHHTEGNILETVRSTSAAWNDILVGLCNKEHMRPSDDAPLAEHTAFYSLQQRLIASVGVDRVLHDALAERPDVILVAHGSVQTSDSGEPQELGEKIRTNPEWGAKLNGFFLKHGLPFTQPKWFLCHD